MSATIERNALDLIVLGQVQYDYTVNGVAGCNYSQAVMQSSFARLVGFESELDTLTRTMQRRSDKLKEIGDAMAAVNAAYAMKGKASLDKSYKSETGNWWSSAESVLQVMKRYGISNVDSHGKEIIYASDGHYDTTFGGLQLLTTHFQLANDQENNEIQQDLSSAKNVMSKRDSASSQLGKLQKKISGAEQTAIAAIGG